MAHEGLNSIPTTYVKKLGVVVIASNVGAEGIKAKQILVVPADQAA